MKTKDIIPENKITLTTVLLPQEETADTTDYSFNFLYIKPVHTRQAFAFKDANIIVN